MRSPCCASATSGHAPAPPTSEMKSRRLIVAIIRSPRRRQREASAAQSADAIKVVRKLLTKSAPHLGQCLLACGLVTSAIGCTRPRHGLPDSINRLSRYFPHPFLNGFQRTRCRLRARSGHGFRSSRWPGGSFCFEHGIDLCLHGGEVVPTWAAVTRRNRGGERKCCVRCYGSHSHDSTSKTARFSPSTSLDHLVGAREQRQRHVEFDSSRSLKV